MGVLGGLASESVYVNNWYHEVVEKGLGLKPSERLECGSQGPGGRVDPSLSTGQTARRSEIINARPDELADDVVMVPHAQPVVDAGNPTRDGRDTKCVVTMAQSIGIKQFDYILATHYDGDHVANITNVDAQSDGTFTVTILRNGFSRTYKP
jgi:hypothetical protein